MVPATPLTISATGASQKLVTGRALLTFVRVRETTLATGATFRLWDGESNGGQLLYPGSLAAGESDGVELSASPLVCERGIFFEDLAGTVEGVVGAVLEIIVGPHNFAALVHGYYERGEVVG